MATSYEMLILSYCYMAYFLATWLTCCVMVKLFRYYLMAYVLRSGLLGHILDELYDDITSSYLSRLIWLLWGLYARLVYIDMHAYLRVYGLD